MQAIPDKSIDMILCDLPYGTTACKWDVIIPFEPLWKQYERVIKDNGAIVLTASQPFTSALVMSNVKMFKYEWIWEKSIGTGFLNSKKQPLRSHENVLVFYKSQPLYTPQMTSKEDSKGRIKKAPFSKAEVYNDMKLVEYKDTGLRFPRSVAKIYDDDRFNSAVLSKHKHPTQKPVALFEYLIKTYTNEGETVLDNCAGSGTTAISCINTNRNYILFEKEEKYYNIILDRIRKHVPQMKLAV